MATWKTILLPGGHSSLWAAPAPRSSGAPTSHKGQTGSDLQSLSPCCPSTDHRRGGPQRPGDWNTSLSTSAATATRPRRLPQTIYEALTPGVEVDGVQGGAEVEAACPDAYWEMESRLLTRRPDRPRDIRRFPDAWGRRALRPEENKTKQKGISWYWDYLSRVTAHRLSSLTPLFDIQETGNLVCLSNM